MTACFLSVTMDDKEYRVEGKYYKANAASWDAPAEPEMFVIHNIVIYNSYYEVWKDVTHHVTQEQWERLETLCIQAYHNQDELAREERAIAKYEEN